MRKLQLIKEDGLNMFSNPVFKIGMIGLDAADGMQQKKYANKSPDQPQEEWSVGYSGNGTTDDGRKVKGQVVDVEKAPDGTVVRIQIMEKGGKKSWVSVDDAGHRRVKGAAQQNSELPASMVTHDINRMD